VEGGARNQRSAPLIGPCPGSLRSRRRPAVPTC
jgi:hypothetical protein